MISYYLLIPFFYFFAYLPTSILYGISQLLAFILKNVIHYRRQVVLNNLRNSFPEKSEQEIGHIAAESYRHLADRVVENIRCLVISREEINKRMQVKNPEVLDKYYAQHRSIVVMVGHIGAWEFGGYKLSIMSKYYLFGIVSLVSNPYFNNMIQRTRGKMGMHLIPMNKSRDFFKEPLSQLSLGVFISDQSPSNPDKACWTRFLNQDTAFFTGAERYAKTHNCVVIYPKIVEVKQGHFLAEFIIISEDPNESPDNEITEKFARLLEQQIRENPADWLWSHRRWKHKRKDTQ